MIGENSSALPVSLTLAQFTPSPKTCPGESTEFARPTPMIAPINVCELEAGNPKYQVPRFQMIALTSSENTIANPAPEPTLRTSSTGKSAKMPNATAPLEISTPIRFQPPLQTTACHGRSAFV